MRYTYSLRTQSLQTAIYFPVCVDAPTLLRPLAPQKCHKASSDRLFWRAASKYVLQALGLAALILPTKSLTHVQPLSAIEKVHITKTLRVASDQALAQNARAHGVAFDAVSRYADHLGVRLRFENYPNDQAARGALQNGEIDIVLSHKKDAPAAQYAAIQCSGGDAGFVFGKGGDALSAHAKNYLCQPNAAAQTRAMAAFYQKNPLNAYGVAHFERAVAERLPRYKAEFLRQAAKYNHDWRLLVAVGYQESHLNPSAVSPTGVEGLMMLTRDTAKAMGVSDRTDATQSIQGGAKYLAQLTQDFAHIPAAERLWFTLAAYNMGPNAVKDVQKRLLQAGKNPDRWSNVYTYLQNNAHKNGRYAQCVHYVTHIRAYADLLYQSGA